MRSIRGRVVLLVLAAQLVAAVGAVGLSIWYVHRAVWSSVDSELKAAHGFSACAGRRRCKKSGWSDV